MIEVLDYRYLPVLTKRVVYLLLISIAATPSLQPGQYLRMHNVHASCYHVGKDQLEVVDLCIHRGMRSGSGVTVLPMDDPDVVQLKE